VTTSVDARDWDERHADPERRYSGGPSEVLVAELSSLAPGFAIDDRADTLARHVRTPEGERAALDLLVQARRPTSRA
jgi:hypothetical protein